MTYAVNSKVPVSRSRDEIERLLLRYGASGFAYAMEPGRAMIAFQTKERVLKFLLPLAREARMSQDKFAQFERSRWRALALCIKAKLESVAAGIETFDEAFLSNVVMPNGQTMAEHSLPYIKEAYATGKMPPILSFDAGGT